MNTPYEDLIDSIDNHTMVKNVAGIMHFEFSKLTKKEQIEYLEDLLGELSNSSLKTYFEDLGCLEAYIERHSEALEYRKAAS